MLAMERRNLADIACVQAPAIKICGIMCPEHAISASACGADMIGLVFAESRRQISIETAKGIREALDTMGQRAMLVGVFVNETPQRICEVACEVGLDVVQLSGDESSIEVAECAQRYPVIKALRFSASLAVDETLELCHSYTSLGLGERVRLLVDAYHPSAYGGTGQKSDWAMSAELARHHALILAGGLAAENVAEAMEVVSPAGLDVSSGVERNGMKDLALIEAFIRAVHDSKVIHNFQ